ncbi:MAG: 50S ribosomal protein L24 [Bacteroidales bacterium]|nr:50S ribosomal protein L24 [Bacteroidales bacterium]
MTMKLHVKKGDTVLVLSGNDKGKQGKVMSVDRKSQRAIVEGVRIISKHTRPNAEHPQGGIIKQEAPIHISNLMVVDNSGKPTRVGRKLDEKSGKLVRYSKKTGEIIK